jgi:hypothetical protein
MAMSESAFGVLVGGRSENLISAALESDGAAARIIVKSSFRIESFLCLHGVSFLGYERLAFLGYERIAAWRRASA